MKRKSHLFEAFCGKFSPDFDILATNGTAQWLYVLCRNQQHGTCVVMQQKVD